jgi:outer membrane protein OmpA-like peptidoglycan-associated protein
MKKITAFTFAIILLTSTILTSCDSLNNMNRTQKGAGIGAAAGAILGGVLGNNLGKGGNGALGAVLGGAFGGIIGGAIGQKMDKQARKISEALPGATVERIGEGIKLTLGENAVRFETNKATLTTDAKANIDKLVPVFKEYSKTDIKIFGYTDSSGKPEYNLVLSEKRADAVKKYLVAHGISDSRFNIIGMGIADPIATNDTDAGKSENRRVEFAIIANAAMIEETKTETGN